MGVGLAFSSLLFETKQRQLTLSLGYDAQTRGSFSKDLAHTGKEKQGIGAIDVPIKPRARDPRLALDLRPGR